LRLLGKASLFVAHRHRRCRSRSVRSSWTHDAPSAELLALLGILRNPAEAEDHLSPEVLDDLPGVDVYADWVRVARVHSRPEFYVFGSRNLAGFTYGSPAAAARETSLRRLLVDKPRHFSRLAPEMQASFARAKYPKRPLASSEAISLFERRSESTSTNTVGDGASFSLGLFRKVGVWISPFGAGRNFTILVPDDVATITPPFPRVGREAPQGQRRTYDTRVDYSHEENNHGAVGRAPGDPCGVRVQSLAAARRMKR